LKSVIGWPNLPKNLCVKLHVMGIIYIYISIRYLYLSLTYNIYNIIVDKAKTENQSVIIYRGAVPEK